MKKLFTTFFILIFLFAAIVAPMPASANVVGSPTFSLGNVQAVQGGEVKVPIIVTNNPGFAGVGFAITFETRNLEFNRVETLTTQLPENPHNQVIAGSNTQWISLVAPIPTDFPLSDRPIADLVFDVQPNADIGNTPITLGWTDDPDGRPVSNATGNILTGARTAPGNVNISEASGGSDPGTGTQTPPGERPEGQFGVTMVNGGTGSSGVGWYAPNATVTLNAGTRTGFTFNGWTISPATVTITNPSSAAGATFRMPSQDVTVTANWTADSGAGGGGTGGNNNNTGGNNNNRPGEGGDGTGTAYTVLSNFTTFTGSGTSTARVDADHNKFVRLLLDGEVVNASNYTVTAGSTIITLNESYLRTFANGTYIFRAEFTDGYADMTLIVSSTFGNVPQTGVGDMTGTEIVMWLSIFMTAFLSVKLFMHLRSKRKHVYYGD